MAVQVKFRRGNTSQHSTFTGAEAEITVNTEKDILVVHDGSTAGGHEVARVNNPYFNGTVNVANVTFSNSLHPNSNGTLSIGNGTFRWEKLWLSNSGISIGVNAHTITTNSTTFIFSQNVTTNDSFIIVQGANVGPVVNTSGFYGNVTATGYINVGNSTVNTTINATSFTGDSATVGGNTASNLNTYADNKAANAYSNAVAYADGRIIDSVTNTSIAYAASANSVKNAYDRAIDANTRAASAQTEASAAYSNSVTYIDTKIGTANTSMAANAAAAYSNAIAFASNVSNVNTGTLAEARLPFRMDQNVRTTDTVQFNNLTLSGNLVVNGGVVTVTGNSVSFTDNMLYINQGILATITNIVGNGSVVVVTANNNYQVGWDVTITGVNPSAYNSLHNNIIAVNSTSFSFSSALTDTYVSGGNARGKSDANPDIGFAAGYNDGSYHHTGFFRDATDGIFKVFDGYDPEPDASIFIDTSNTSFHIANFQANTIYAGNTSTNWFVANTTGVYHTGIISGSVLAKTDSEDSYISNTTATITQTAIDSFSATTYRSAKYIIQATNSTSYHYTEVAIVHDGTTAYATEFATMFTGSSLVSFDVDISAGNVRLLATATNATTTTYKIDRKLIKV